MFDIGFGELILVFVIGLVVLGPERLPVVVRTVAGWIRAIRSMASTVQNELTQELKLQELQDSLEKVEETTKNKMSPELKASMDELHEASEFMKKEFKGINSAALDPPEPDTIHNPLVTDPEAVHDGVTLEESDRQAKAPSMAQSVEASSADSAGNPATQAVPSAAPEPALEAPCIAATAPGPASSTSSLNNDR